MAAIARRSRLLLPLLLVLAGCQPRWRSRFPDGTKLYEKADHRYFGKVIGYDNAHDFHNNTERVPAIYIEQAEAGQDKTWGACAVCESDFEVQPP